MKGNYNENSKKLLHNEKSNLSNPSNLPTPEARLQSYLLKDATGSKDYRILKSPQVYIWNKNL